MELNCTTDKYEALYAPWLANPGKLLDAVGWEPGQIILDLCGGTGAISRECIWRGADPSTVHLLDLNPRCMDDRITIYKGDANRLGKTFGSMQPDCHRMFDVVVIRQAAAYLDWSGVQVIWLMALLKPGGKLVFNIFEKAPRVRLKMQEYAGRTFFEAGFRLLGRVYHLQASPGLGFDVTRFRQPDLNRMAKLLGYHFDLCITGKSNSQTWVCTRRIG